jgi:tRNA-dihydrouridine synthase
MLQNFASDNRFPSLGIRFPVFVAPMVGLSHVALRQLVREFTPAGLDTLLFTEMLSSLRLPSERPGSVDELRISPDDEGRLIPQLLGNEEWYIERSLRRLESMKPWGVDINMGCPVKHSLRHNWGVRLLGDPDYAAQVVATTCQHTNRPVSVKLRCGRQQLDLVYMREFTRALQDAGAGWLTIHARSQAQKHRGDANWGAVAELRSDLNVPVVVNGDVQCLTDVETILNRYAIDGVMIGRAITARPWLLWQIGEALGYTAAPARFAGHKAPRTPEDEGRLYLLALARYIELLQEYFPNPAARWKRFKFYLLQSHKWLFYGHALYARCMKLKDLAAIRQMLEREYVETASFPMTGRVMLH